MTLDFELLKRLCETPAVPGREEALRSLTLDTLRPLADMVRVDTLGNVVAVRRGQGARTVMIAAHMDEIGFLVRFVDKRGFLRLQPVGGFDPRALVAQRVLVHSASTTHRGTLMPAAKPAHLLAEGEIKPPKLDEFFVDLGMPAEMVAELVEIGDPVTLDRTTEQMGECVVSKALDDRLGLFVMIEALRAVRDPAVDIMAVATVQEEVGLRGAMTAAYDLQPDIAVALDITIALDIPGHDEEQAITRLGAGTAIKVMDSSLICHPKLVRQFREIARRHNIPHQMEILPRGGTDAGAMQRSRAGVAAITLSIPSRYVHTVNETAHVRDIQASIDLLARFLEEAHTSDLTY